MSRESSKRPLRREAALFVGLLFAGFVIMPLLLFWIGPQVLGEFGGRGYADFFGELSARVRRGDGNAWFFILSPYLAVQTLRLTYLGWRATGRAAERDTPRHTPDL